MQSAKALNMKLLLLLGLLWGSVVIAAEPKAAGDGGVAIKKAQGLIRQLSQEKTALEAEKTAWLNEKAVLEGKLKSLEDTVKKLQPLQAEVDHYKSDLETTKTHLDAQLDQERQQKQVMLKKHNDVVVKANAISADNQLLVQAVKEREQWIEQCTKTNKELQSVNQDVINKYQQKGLFQQVIELEPITGIGQIETESAVEDYKYKLQQLKITPFKGKEQVAEPAPAEQNNESLEAKP